MNVQPERLRLRLSMALADVSVVVGSLITALAWYRLSGDAVWEREFSTLALALLPTTAVIFQLGGVYDPLRVGRVTISRALWCFALVVCLFLGVGYVLKISSHFSRAVVGAWIVLSVVGLIGMRLAIHGLTTWRRRHGLDLQPTALVGSSSGCAAMRRHLRAHPELGLRVVATALSDAAPPSDATSEQPAVAVRDDVIESCALDDLAATVIRLGIGRVIVCGDLAAHQLVLRVAVALIHCPVAVQYAPDLSALPIFCLRSGDIGGMPVINLSSSPLSETALLVKWLEDKVLSLLFLFVSSPLLLFIAALIKLTSPGPVFFVQERHGRGGHVIRVFKFRTMRHALADAALAPAVAGALAAPAAALATATPAAAADGGSTRYHRSQRLEASVSAGATRTTGTTGSRVAMRDVGDAQPDDFVQARRDDPRITPLGRILRRSSLDELPQFLNVLRGDMSLVGPRPHALKHNQQFAASIQDLMRRHYVKPGITGLAQINGARGETRSIGDMQKRVSYDLQYIQNWSLWLDLKIIALTVLRGFYNNQP